MSTAGGTEPGWRADGKELFYVAPDDRLMAARVDTRGGTFEVKTLEPLFGPIDGGYNASADGQRFLVAVRQGGGADPPLTVVQNWSAALKPVR